MAGQIAVYEEIYCVRGHIYWWQIAWRRWRTLMAQIDAAIILSNKFVYQYSTPEDIFTSRASWWHCHQHDSAIPR